MDQNDDAPIIRIATSAADYEAFGQVCRAYVDWCRARYAEMPWFVEEVFGHQALDAELEVLAVKYGPPEGRAMIVLIGDEVVGGGAYRRRSEEVCELKRLFVGDRGRGLGLGRKLSEALIALAQADGFKQMQLDTSHLMVEATAMYERLGFERIPPYQVYPERLKPYLIFMQKTL